jgi:hypothetical protein
MDVYTAILDGNDVGFGFNHVVNIAVSAFRWHRTASLCNTLRRLVIALLPKPGRD